ncbi:hypothetical protein F5Y16DRAFT_357787 [Xylariaceae sp. FL0255]|nr:hypothetical protein F5Y16DRAFT_357787 [Xylariaceae sp. FL0255]
MPVMSRARSRRSFTTLLHIVITFCLTFKIRRINPVHNVSPSFFPLKVSSLLCLVFKAMPLHLLVAR